MPLGHNQDKVEMFARSTTEAIICEIPEAKGDKGSAGMAGMGGGRRHVTEAFFPRRRCGAIRNSHRLPKTVGDAYLKGDEDMKVPKPVWTPILTGWVCPPPPGDASAQTLGRPPGGGQP
jgi:hypothetical protein